MLVEVKAIALLDFRFDQINLARPAWIPWKTQITYAVGAPDSLC